MDGYFPKILRKHPKTICNDFFKKSRKEMRGTGVVNGARTHDPQNHNLML